MTIVVKSSADDTSANSQNNPLSNLFALQSLTSPTQASSGVNQSNQGGSLLTQALKNYFAQGVQTAGTGQQPSVGSALMSSVNGQANGLDNSTTGQLVKGIGGNQPGNGYASQLMQGMFGGNPSAASSQLMQSGTPAAAGVVDGAGTDAAGSAAGSTGMLGQLVDSIMSLFAA